MRHKQKTAASFSIPGSFQSRACLWPFHYKWKALEHFACPIWHLLQHPWAEAHTVFQMCLSERYIMLAVILFLMIPSMKTAFSTTATCWDNICIVLPIMSPSCFPGSSPTAQTPIVYLWRWVLLSQCGSLYTHWHWTAFAIYLFIHPA